MKKQHTTEKKLDFIDELLSMTPLEIDQMMKTNAKPPKKVRLYHMVDKKKYPSFEELKSAGSIFYASEITKG